MSKIRMTWDEVSARSLENLMVVSETGTTEQIAHANTDYTNIKRSIEMGEECPYVKYSEGI